MKAPNPKLDALLDQADEARARVSRMSDAQRADLEARGRQVVRSTPRRL